MTPGAADTSGRRASFLRGLPVQISNPKALLFFVAILPQFIDRGRPIGMQIVIFGVTSIVIESWGAQGQAGGGPAPGAGGLGAYAKGTLAVTPGQVMNLVKNSGTLSAAEKFNLLAPQEKRVVALLAEGLTNKEIGGRLGLTEKTVKNYLAGIFTKLNITRRTQAATLFTEAAGSDSR